MRSKNEYLFTEEQIDTGRRFVMHWDDFIQATDTLPEYEVPVRNLIFARLGYLPPTEMVFIPYESFFKTLFAFYQGGKITLDAFHEETNDIIKKIRNDDLKKHGLAAAGLYGKKDYHHYETHLPAYKTTARQRLSNHLGYEPQLQHSLYAETHLRQLMLEDDYYEGMPLDRVDHRSFAIYLYNREAIENGVESADASPVIRIEDWQSVTVQPGK